MIGLGFLNGWLLWLLPLAAIPIIIHLLNRRRFSRISWAAMTFLIAAMRRNRRRLQLEHWLLLALRTLAVVLLVFAVSRPRFDENVFGGVRTHHVVCLDDSASMAHRGAATNAFEDAIAAVQRLAADLAANRTGDVLTILTAADPEHPPLSLASVGPNLDERVRQALAGCRIGDGRLAPPAVLAAAERTAAASDDAEAVHYYVVTDLQAVDWLDAEGGPDAAVRDWLLRRDATRESVTLLPVGSTDRANLAIADVACRERVCTAETPLTFAVTVVNRGADAVGAGQVTVQIDDRHRASYPTPPLGPAQSASIELAHTFQAPGPHGITATLAEDRYATDDRRALALDVRDRSPVLLVDGDPGDSPMDAETYFLHAALDSGVDARLIGAHELDDVTDDELAQNDMVWLCNVARPSPAAVLKLAEFVRGGGGLVVFFGDQVDVAHYDAVLWHGGDGLLPARPTGIAGDMDAPQFVHLAAKDDPLFATNTENFEFEFEQAVAVGRWIEVEAAPQAGTRVLLRIRDSEGPPLLLSREVGSGRVFLVTTAADMHWTNWPAYPAYLMTMLGIHRTAARPQDGGALNLTPFGSLHLSIDPGRHAPEVTVARQGDELSTAQTFAATVEGAGPAAVDVPMSRLDGYGLFTAELRRHDGGRDRRAFSRNGLADEGRFERVSPAAFRRVYPEELEGRVEFRESGGAATDIALAGDTATWRWLGLALLLGMLGETVLAWRFGRR